MTRTIIYDQKEMWNSIQTLSKINVEQAKAVLNVTIQRSFRHFGIVLPVSSSQSLTLPEPEELQRLQQLEGELNDSLEKNNDLRFEELLAEYIEQMSTLTANDLSSVRNKILPSATRHRRGKRVHYQLYREKNAAVLLLKREDKPFYTPKEVGVKLGLSDQTIRRMCEKGKFPNAYQTDGGHWRIPREAFITTSMQDEQAETILQRIDKKNLQSGDIDEFNL
ncbi:helix-turn-helix domain-containing protein [Sporolactobacillus kofuensis]|uniref:Helix-turn-helix domain-containing protein n=1 Tax=Sporolactobacillus kofuensis TaxID=269672 RepID=A0ABW1WCJ6_9BACL|nr:helix-turn-helix domain-containing protein [Sporolactobacillus kofuensis]MCO7175415.1 helix-turn-helix domain-containing protein [Sporolactobacillus kofuensis]